MGEVENPRMQNIINMMHVINANRKVNEKQLSKEEILKQIEEVKKKPSTEIIDFQMNYIKGMEEEAQAFFQSQQNAAQQQPIQQQTVGVQNPNQFTQQPTTVFSVEPQQTMSEQNCWVKEPEYGLDVSSLVENYNPKPVRNNTPNNTLLLGGSQVGGLSANLTEGGSIMNGNGYFNISDIVKPSISEVTVNETQGNNFSSLVMTPEEEASHFYGFDINKVGEGNTYEQDMFIAHNMMHPNVAL